MGGYYNPYMDEQLIELIKQHEGFRRHAYQDSEGFWTIGFGRLIDKRRGGGVSVSEAELLCRNDIRRAEKTVQKIFPQWQYFSDNRYHGLVSMAFNLGESGFAKFVKMRAAIDARNWRDAADEALDSLWAKQVPVRAGEIAHLLRAG